MTDFRCEKCNKLLGKYRECSELEIKCPRCGFVNKLCIGKISKPDAQKKGRQVVNC